MSLVRKRNSTYITGVQKETVIFDRVIKVASGMFICYIGKSRPEL